MHLRYVFQYIKNKSDRADLDSFVILIDDNDPVGMSRCFLQKGQMKNMRPHWRNGDFETQESSSLTNLRLEFVR